MIFLTWALVGSCLRFCLLIFIIRTYLYDFDKIYAKWFMSTQISLRKISRKLNRLVLRKFNIDCALLTIFYNFALWRHISQVIVVVIVTSSKEVKKQNSSIIYFIACRSEIKHFHWSMLLFNIFRRIAQ